MLNSHPGTGGKVVLAQTKLYPSDLYTNAKIIIKEGYFGKLVSDGTVRNEGGRGAKNPLIEHVIV